MEKRKSRPVVFVPVVEWVVLALLFFGGLFIRLEGRNLAMRMHRRPGESTDRIEENQRFIREFFTGWGTLQGVALGMFLFVCCVVSPPVLVVGRKRLWVVRAFGLYVRRIPAENIHSLTLQWMPVAQTDRAVLMTEAGDVFEFMHVFRTRRIAEAIQERFGIKIHRENASGSLARGDRWHNPYA